MLFGEGAVNLGDLRRFVCLDALLVGTLRTGGVLLLLILTVSGGLQHRIGTPLERDLLWMIEIFLTLVVRRSCASLKSVKRCCFALGDLLLVELQQRRWRRLGILAEVVFRRVL